jgi:hypothetical protein
MQGREHTLGIGQNRCCQTKLMLHAEHRLEDSHHIFTTLNNLNHFECPRDSVRMWQLTIPESTGSLLPSAADTETGTSSVNLGHVPMVAVLADAVAH